MTGMQVELFQEPRHVADQDVRWLEGACHLGKDWMTAAELLGLLLRPATDDGRRWIRELASKSERIISGQKGYKHIERATAEEINHACNWMESQAKKMGERASALRRNAHKIFG